MSKNKNKGIKFANQNYLILVKLSGFYIPYIIFFLYFICV